MPLLSNPEPPLVNPNMITEHHPDYAPYSIELPSKPGAQIKYRFFHKNDDAGAKEAQSKKSQTLVVLLNGLLMSMDSWLPVISALRSAELETTLPLSIISYDRYGQGFTTDHDPSDAARVPGDSHDCQDAAKDLVELLQEICLHHLSQSLSNNVNLLLVGNSIGCAIARLFTPLSPVPIPAFLFLDSIMANSTFDFWPNPSSPSFNPSTLPPDLTPSALHQQREFFLSRFSPSVPNKENLNRENLRFLLPHADKPSLIQRKEGGEVIKPWVTVVGHDPKVFARNSLEQMGTAEWLSREFTNPIWDEYLRGMMGLTSKERSGSGKGREGVVVARGAGHFIQVDRPDLVVEGIVHLLKCIQETT